VVCLGLDIGRNEPAAWAWARATASAESVGRAARFPRPRDALRHLASRAALRTVLAGLGLDVPPAVEPGGRPILPGSGLHLSIAHGGDEVWIALTRAAPVGIDAEPLHPGLPPAELAAALHPDELAALDALPAGAARDAALIRCWTRREAVSKADGRGIAGLPPEAIEVAFDPKAQGWLRHAPGPAPSAWTCRDLGGPPGTGRAMAAVAPGLGLWVLRLDPATGELTPEGDAGPLV